MTSNETDQSAQDDTRSGLTTKLRFPSHLSSSNPFRSSPPKHHQRTVSAQRRVKETRDARSEYMQSEDDGASQRRINQYLIQQEIGRGSFGSVHLATDQFGNEYAVKEFSKHRLRRRAKSNLLRQAKQQQQQHQKGGLPGLLDPSPQRKQMSDQEAEDNAFDLIREEIAIMKKLNHENLVSLIEVLDDPEEDSLYMVLEMCKKGVIMRIDIEDIAEPYAEEDCRLWFRDLMLGIEYLHSQGVVHRDIKPDNCLLTDDDTLKLVDFGVSEMFDKGSDMKIAKSAGSPAFMAPELCEPAEGGVFGKPADIWSMGITLYCLRFGRVPFQRDNLIDLYKAIVEQQLDLPDDCPAELADLFRRLLEKEPKKRITMEQLRAHRWITKNNEDPLLPTNENCAHPVTPPTEEEMNTAITGNMGKLIAVIKAASKFKQRLERAHPELMEGILGRASKMVAPPLTMSYNAGSDLKGKLKRHFSGEAGGADTPVPSSGIYRAADVEKEEESISDRLQKTGISTSTENAPRHSEPAPDPPADINSKARRRESKHTFDESAKGHAHDVTKDRLFVDVGAGPCHKDEEQAPPEPHQHDYVVSESPTQTEESVFETAYKREVDSIQKSGRSSTIFSTRRIDRSEGKDDGSLASTSGADKLRSAFGGTLGKAMQSGGSKLQQKYGDRKGSAPA